MDKETIAVNTQQPPKAGRKSTPARTMSIDEARKLIRKVNKDHAGLFRRLAK